jgi:hypothetical protein
LIVGHWFLKFPATLKSPSKSPVKAGFRVRGEEKN